MTSRLFALLCSNLVSMHASYQFSEFTMLNIRVATSVLQFVGILLSLFRLWFRSRIRRLWWEDAWAFVACVCATVLLAAEWTYLQGGTYRIFLEVSVVSFWVYALGFTLVTWTVRVSLLFSVARIVHSSKNMRHFMTAVAVSFGVMFLITIILKIWWFSEDQTWLKKSSYYTLPARWLPDSMYIYELCTDCISDFILIALPVRMLWSMNLPTNQRRMIIAIFSSGVIVTIVSIFRATSQIMDLVSLVGIATDFEVAFSIITCNLLVVATVLYRLCQRRHVPEPEDDDYTTPVRPPMVTPMLTTVNFSAIMEFSGDSSVHTGSDSEKTSSPSDPARLIRPTHSTCAI